MHTEIRPVSSKGTHSLMWKSNPMDKEQWWALWKAQCERELPAQVGYYAVRVRAELE